MTAWWFVQIGVATAMVLPPAGVMAWRWIVEPCPDPLWYRTVVAMCYTIPCLVQFGAIVALVNMPWPASGVIH